MVTRICEWPGDREVIRGNLPALHVANCFRAKVGAWRLASALAALLWNYGPEVFPFTKPMARSHPGPTATNR